MPQVANLAIIASFCFAGFAVLFRLHPPKLKHFNAKRIWHRLSKRHEWQFIWHVPTDPSMTGLDHCTSAEYGVIYCECGMTSERLGLTFDDGRVEIHQCQIYDWQEIDEGDEDVQQNQ